jgi:hypothetical protein
MEGHLQRHDAAVAFAGELVGLPLEVAIQRVEEYGFMARTLAEDDVITAEMNWDRINLTRASDGSVLRASVG